MIEEALYEAAPIRSFSVKTHHKFGLSARTKLLMAKRDRTRLSSNKASSQSKTVLMSEYKILRNQLTARIRKVSLEFNQDRINKANDEKEIWNIVNEVSKPRRDSEWKIQTDSGITTDEKKIANTLNSYFITKIKDLKVGIDTKYNEGPLSKLKEKLKDYTLKFELKTVSKKKVENTLKKMKKKGVLDGLSQERFNTIDYGTITKSSKQIT